MNTEVEHVNSENGEECVTNGIISSNSGFPDIECKMEVVSEGEDEQDPIGNSQEKEITIKAENSEPKETTADESLVLSMAVEALRQLGGMFDNVSTPIPPPPPSSSPPPPPLPPPPPSVTPVTPYRQHICSICGVTFARKSDLGNHIVCHQVGRPHACRICGNLFRRKADLQNHMVCHQVERPHRCPICGADFQRPSSLTNHMKIHTYFPGRALLASGSLNLNTQNVANSSTITTTTITTSVNEPPMTYIPPSNGWHDGYTNNNMHESDNFQSNSNGNNVDNEFNHKENSGQIISSVQAGENQETQIPSEQNTETCNLNSYENVIQSNNSEEYLDLGVKVEDVPLVPNTEVMPMAPTVEQSESSDDTNRRPHVCRHCGLSFSREKALKCHSRFHQDYWGSPVECDKCEEMFPEEVSLHQHQQICNGSGGKRHQSTQQIAGAEQLDYVQPTKTAKPVGKHACTECERKFTTKQKLFRHMWIHRKTPFVCEICGISVGDKATLDEHRRDIHPGESPYTCNECGKSFASRQGLWEHGRIHASSLVTHASPFLCQRCGKSFASRQGHLIHMRTHTGERPYGCRFCWKAFRDGGTLRKHERIHTGERPHVCPLCPRAFNQKVVLREHVRWVHAARNTDGCQICGYVIADREALCAHIVKHSDQLAAIVKAAKKKQGTEVTIQQEVLTVDPNASTSSYNYTQNEAVDTNANKDIPEVKSEYTCDMCGEAFKQRIELLDHVRIHI